MPDIYLCDAIEGLKRLPAGCADLVLSDLPSGETRAGFDKRANLPALWPELARVLSPTGAVILMAHSMSLAAETTATAVVPFRHDLIWHKSAASGHLNSKRAPLRAHEFVLVFAGAGYHYEPQLQEGATPIHAARRRAHGENYGPMSSSTDSRAGATDRYPVSVLEFGSVGTSAPERKHPQQKPTALLSWLIRSYSSPGAVVVDPYAGSGSTGVAAEAEGRYFVGFDSDPRFATLTPPTSPC